MIKFSKILILILFFLFFLPFIFAESVLFSDFKNQEAPSDYFYPQEFDNLVMDLIIPSGKTGGDTLKAITLENTGSARDFYDIEKLKLWADSGPSGFQGMEVDEELGTFAFYNPNMSWYLTNLDESVPAQGLRIFVSAEISKNATTYRTIQMKIPKLSDVNSNGNFDLGDLGVFWESKNNGPIDEEIINSYSQEIRVPSIDSLAPKTVITDPKDGTKIITSSYTIKGVTKDQGGSTPAWVKISINDIWYDVVNTGENFNTWKYEWKGISEGIYALKAQAADWIGNVATTDPMQVTVSFPKECNCTDWVNDVCGGGSCPADQMNQKRTCTPSGCSTENQCLADKSCIKEKPISEMTIEELKTKITEIQQKIIELLNQLIQLIQSQINQLKK